MENLHVGSVIKQKIKEKRLKFTILPVPYIVAGAMCIPCLIVKAWMQSC